MRRHSHVNGLLVRVRALRGLARAAAFTAIVGLEGATAGCGCKLIGCVPSGLTVQTVPEPMRPYRIEIQAPTDTVRRVWRCDNPGSCGAALFAGFLAPQVHVEVIAGSDTLARQSSTVAYHTTRPNGAGCEPSCTSGTVSIVLGG
jgi:hypothetical protein